MDRDLVFELQAVEAGLEAGAVVVGFGDGLDEGKHVVSRLGADHAGHGVLVDGEAEDELADSGEDVGAGLGGVMTVLFF